LLAQVKNYFEIDNRRADFRKIPDKNRRNEKMHAHIKTKKKEKQDSSLIEDAFNDHYSPRMNTTSSQEGK